VWCKEQKSKKDNSAVDEIKPTGKIAAGQAFLLQAVVLEWRYSRF
jgi:hypothetical protein